jgi:hypothetical protein
MRMRRTRLNHAQHARVAERIFDHVAISRLEDVQRHLPVR